jgi:hypothetical protein
MTSSINRITGGAVSLLSVAVFATIPAMAQINTGSLSGVITDTQGAIVTDAQVTVIEMSTHVVTAAKSNGDGVYAVLTLPIGTYDLTVIHPGFETTTEREIILASGENKKLDIQLSVGQVTSTVSVTGSAPDLETGEVAYDLTEDAHLLVDLPLENNGTKRDPADYMTVFPGYQDSAGVGDDISGSISSYSEVFVDGTPYSINSAVHGDTRNDFGSQGVDEVKIVTTPMADLGNVGGVAISYTAKSGTNQLHGTGYDYFRNTALDATCDQFCPTKQADHQGEFGFTVGGPVRIPHLYDGRNKSFWWANWGHYYYHSSTAESFYGVPTDPMKDGDFSAFLGSQIGTDPSGNPVYEGEIYDPTTTTTVNGKIQRTPFGSGTTLNTISSSSFSSTASKYQSHFPEPKTSSAIPDGTNYTVAGASASAPDGYYTIDGDENIGTRDKLYGTYWVDNQPNIPPFPLPLIFEVATTNPAKGHFIHLNWSHTFTSNLVNQASFGFDRDSVQINGPSAAETGAATIGETNALGPCLPSFAIQGGYMSSTRPDSLCYQKEGDNNFSVDDVWSWVNGRQLFKWGFNSTRWNSNFPRVSNLQASFSNVETSLPVSSISGCTLPGDQPCTSTSTGNPYASFLIGAVDSAETAGRSEPGERSLMIGGFAQDEFKATPKLTLTFGLRYDFLPFPEDVRNSVSDFNPDLLNPGCDCDGAVEFLGFGTGRLGTRKPAPDVLWATNFGPKVGFAYQIERNTVIRGSGTLSYGAVNQIAAGFSSEAEQGFFPSFSTSSPDGLSPAFALDSGYPLPPGESLYGNFNPAIANGGSTAFYGRNSDRAPRIWNTHLGVEHQFPGKVVIGLEFIGSYARGVLLGSLGPINQLNYGQYASYGQTCLASSITAQQTCPQTIPLPYASFTGSVEQALRPFPQYTDIENQSAPAGFSTYNGAQLTAKRAYENGLSFLVGFTISKQFTNYGSVLGDPFPGYFANAPQDQYNLQAEKAVAPEDIPANLLFNYTYQLPVGRGQKVNVQNPVLNQVVGGWTLAGIHSYRSGNPIGVSSETYLFSQPTGGFIGNWVRPNLEPGEDIRTSVSCADFNPMGGNWQSAPHYLNQRAFVMPGPLQFGTSPRILGDARTCPTYNENISLFKSFPLKDREGVNLKVGVDSFNLFNRHIWGGPDGDVQEPYFGSIFGVSSPRSLQLNARLTF